MDSFGGKLAVVTGGATGIGRELVVQLASAGCSVAIGDVNVEAMGETAERAAAAAPGSARITTHRCDVSDEQQVGRFRDEVVEQHATGHVNLVFANAGVSGGGSFLADSRADWDRTFAICWGGVYHCARAFAPLLVASDEAHLVNTSSVNGFWASLGPGIPHTAYSAAKFAVKGFSEALMEDFRINAPHVKVSVVMPGHIGTDIVVNSRKVLTSPEAPDDDAVRALFELMNDGFRDSAPTSPAQAATIILDGVLAGTWRILVGDDAVALDETVRADPIAAYSLTVDSITRGFAGGERRAGRVVIAPDRGDG